jgi:hypothetical protein
MEATYFSETSLPEDGGILFIIHVIVLVQDCTVSNQKTTI